MNNSSVLIPYCIFTIIMYKYYNKKYLQKKDNWASSWDYGTYHIGIARAFAVRTWSMEEDVGSDQKPDI